MIKDFCAGGLVFLQGKLVVLKRFNGAWLFPKGHIDPGEDAPTAALREVKEESGLTARIAGKLGVTAYTFKQNGEEHDKTVEWFTMIAESDQVELEKEFFDEYRLIDETEINLLSFEHDRNMAVKAFRMYKGGELS